MINIYVKIGQTADNDYVLNTENGFTIAYIGRGSYTGNVAIHTYHEYSESENSHLIYIGRYTSIGDNVRIYCDINHDYRSVYMGVIPEFADPDKNAPVRERVGQNTKKMIHRGMVIIGNDVWIGDDVTIISDVTIGNGAVIGAGSVVAKDIPPYTIWCGNPAVCIGNRFSSEITEALEKISWWEWDRSKLKNAETYMKDDPEVFVSKYEPLAGNFIIDDTLFCPDDDLPVMIAFLDAESDYPTYGDIMESFITDYSDKSAHLIIYYQKNSENDVFTIESLSGLISKLNGKVNLYTIGIEPEDEEFVISMADLIILGRDIRNIKRISYALKYGKKIISAANRPIFPGKM